ncbi:MAG: hypothetical protein ACYTEQ_29335 [Planctomycetota bacterium]
MDAKNESQLFMVSRDELSNGHALPQLRARSWYCEDGLQVFSVSSAICGQGHAMRTTAGGRGGVMPSEESIRNAMLVEAFERLQFRVRR